MKFLILIVYNELPKCPTFYQIETIVGLALEISVDPWTVTKSGCGLTDRYL
jgi:hypothetical protein